VLHAALTGNGISIEDFNVASLDAALALEPDGSVDDEKTAWQVEAGGHFKGLTQAGQPLPVGLGDAIEWSLAGKAAPSEPSIALDHLTAQGAGLDLVAKGKVSPQAAAGTISLTVAELGAFGGLAKLPRLHGRLSIDGDVTTDDKGHITASLKGGAEDFGLGIKVADAILAPTVSIDTVAERHEDGQISLSNLNIVTPTATVTGNANYAPDSDALTGKLVATMPRLDPLAPAISASIRGDATATVDLGGSPDHPSLQARVESRDLNIESVPIRRLTAQLSVADLNQPSGMVSAAFDLAGMPTRLDTGYAMPNDDLLTVRKLILSAGSARLSGNIDYDLARELASGKLTGNVPDLQPWSSLAGQTLAGKATLSVNLVPRERQVAEFEINGTDVKIGAAKDAIQLSQIKLQGRGHNLTDNPAGKVTLDLAGVVADTLHLDSLHLDADIRSDSAIGFDGQADGELTLAGEGDQQRRLPLTLDLAGDWSQGKDGQAITLSRFAGKLDKDEAKLLQPLSLSLGAVETRVTGLDLDLAGGRIIGDGRLGKDRITLKLDARKLPLEVAGRFLAQPLSGTLDIAADLDGSLAAPGGELAIKGQDIKIADAEGAQIPPLDLTLTLTPKAGQVAVDGEASMPDTKLLTVTGNLPLDLTAASAVDMIPAHRPMALKFDGDGQLQGLVDLLALGEDRLTGNYKVALTVAGTRAEPEIGGQLALSDGRYLNQAFGTELRSIAATLQGDQTHLTLTHFSAQDPRGGNLTASGSIDLAASPVPLLAFKATLSSLRVANSDTARVTANGDIGIAGSLTEPKVTANLTIPRAEFRIPDRLPPSVPTLNVIVIDSRDPHSTAQRLAEARQQAAHPQKAFRVALDIHVTIPGQTFVRGHGLESEWRGRIGMTGDSRNPEIAGRLQTVRGTIDFLGKSFVIRRGVITFPTGEITDPRMEMLAEYNASDIVAQVSVTGSPTAPTLVLSSTPQLPQDEVLSRVLFGRDSGSITPAQGAQLALAANSLANGGPGILDRLREGIGLDRLDFGSTSTSPGAPPPSRSSGSPTGGSHTEAGPTVSGGKYIAPGVFVGLEQGTTPESSRAKVEVDITRGLTGYSSVGEQSNQVGVDWRMDY
jgi:translocation and assembly module TamB